MQSDAVASDPILRLPALQHQFVPLSKQRIYALISKGLFPQPVAIGANAVGWRQSEVLAYLERIAAERALKAAGVSRRRGPSPHAAITIAQ